MTITDKIIHLYNEVIQRNDLPREANQYLLWNQHNHYQTNSCKWVTTNIELLSQLKNTSFTDQLIATLKNIDSYIEMQKLLFLDEQEYKHFLQFSNVVLFKKSS